MTGKVVESEFEYNNDFYRLYELPDDNGDYARIVSEPKKAMDIVRTKNEKTILELDSEK